DEIGTPEYITSDDAQVEYLAIRKAFGQEVTVHLCLWHVIKAWACNFSSLIVSAEGTRAKNKELRETAIGELRSILYEPDLTRARHKIADFQTKWETHNEGRLWSYLKDRYFNELRQKRWMKAHRTGRFYAGMDTNNYVESWHNHLKSHFLSGNNNCRGDKLIYILSQEVVAYYKALSIRSFVCVGHHSKGEKMDIKEQDFLQRKTKEERAEMVIDIAGKFCVKSFASHGALYLVDVNDGHIIKCNCLHNSFTRRPCKHMYLLEKVSEEKGCQLSIPQLQLRKTQTIQAIQAAVEVSESSFDLETNAMEIEDEMEVRYRMARERIQRVFLQQEYDTSHRDPKMVEFLEEMADGLEAGPQSYSTSSTKKRQRQLY
ncbi:hypothetical protein BGZ76_006092, partial [Entomortierella beljakovae]